MTRSRLTKFLLLSCALVLTACAHVEAPTGGQMDPRPLELVAVRPDSLALVPDLRDPVVFVFDERLSEQRIDEAVLVSPRTSAIRTSRRGSELRVSLLRGWEPGRIYHVTLRPIIQDLFNNRIPEPIHLVFSTGPAIPDTELSGTVIDRITGRPELDVRVEAIRQPDSLVYAVPTDSAGRFSLGRIPEGEYRIRAYRDLNRNRELDPFEPRDSSPATITVGAPVTVGLRIVMPDTTPPAVASAQVSEGRIEVLFDDHLDEAQEISPAQIRITGPDGALVPVARAAVGQLEPPAEAPEQPEDAPPAPAAPAAPRGAPAERLPSQTLVIEPAAPLAPGMEYRVQVDAVRNVVGLVGGGEATFTTPAAPPAPAAEPPPDTVPAPPRPR